MKQDDHDTHERAKWRFPATPAIAIRWLLAVAILLQAACTCDGSTASGLFCQDEPPPTLTLDRPNWTLAPLGSGTVAVAVGGTSGRTYDVQSWSNDGLTVTPANSRGVRPGTTVFVEFEVPGTAVPGHWLTITVKAIKSASKSNHTTATNITVVVVHPFDLVPLVVAGAPGTTVRGELVVQRHGGFTGAVTPSITGLPAGWNPPRFPAGTSSDVIPVEIDVPASAPAINHSMTFTGTAAGTALTASTTLRVDVSTQTASDFSLSATPDLLTVTQGQSAATTISIAATAPGLGAVTMSLKSAVPGDAIPAGVTHSFNTVGGAASTLTLSVASTVTPGVYPLLVEGSAGTLVRSTPLTLTVVEAPDFVLSVQPDTITLIAGSQGSRVLTVARTGAVGAVALTYSGTPAGMTIAFANDPLTGPSTGVTIQTTALTPPGTHVVTLRGNAAGLTRTTSLTVYVNAPPPPANNFAVQLALDSVTMAPGTMVTVPVHLPRTGQLVGASVALTSLFNQNLGYVWIAPSVSRVTTATLQVAVSSGIRPDVYRAVVTGASGGLIRVDTLVVTVAPSTAQDFSLVPDNKDHLVLTRGAPVTTMGLAIQRPNGFAGSVDFSEVGAAALGVSITFTPQVANGTTFGTVATLYAAPNATPGIHAITFRGVSGTLTRDVVLTVLVN